MPLSAELLRNQPIARVDGPRSRVGPLWKSQHPESAPEPTIGLRMELIADILFVSGLVLLPAAAVVAGGFALGWLERFQPPAGERPNGIGHAVAAVPYAALSAAMVLAPVVVAVAAVIAEEQAVAYLATVGFALGALALGAMAASREAAGAGPLWPRMPGVMLTSAVGFFIALTSFLGGALARTLGVRFNDGWRVVVPIVIALLVGGLGVAAHRRRRADAQRSEVAAYDTAAAQNE